MNIDDLIPAKSVEALSSPIGPLLNHLGKFPAIICPERKDDLRNLFEELAVRIQLISGQRFGYFKAVINTKTHQRIIRVSVVALERLWAYGYGFLALVEAAKAAPQGSEINLDALPGQKLALDLLNWARDGELTQSMYQWPNHFPTPGTADDPAVAQADALFIHVVGFMLLHELGHHQLGHLDQLERPDRYVGEELEADAFAADFLLQNCPREAIHDADFINRCSGIAVGMTLLAGHEIQNAFSRERCHPKIPERLLEFFEKHIPEVAGTAPIQQYPMYFAAIVLGAFMQISHLPFEKVHADFTEFFVRAIRAFP